MLDRIINYKKKNLNIKNLKAKDNVDGTKLTKVDFLARVLLKRAELKIKLNYIDAALKDYKYSVKLKYINQKRDNLAPINFNQIIDYDKFLKGINKELKANYYDDYVHLLEGTVHYKLNKMESAKKSYNKAIKANPKNIQALYNLGIVHYETDDLTESYDFF